jgi:hypothetical protein
MLCVIRASDSVCTVRRDANTAMLVIAAPMSTITPIRFSSRLRRIDIGRAMGRGHDKKNRDSYRFPYPTFMAHPRPR